MRFQRNPPAWVSQLAELRELERSLLAWSDGGWTPPGLAAWQRLQAERQRQRAEAARLAQTGRAPLEMWPLSKEQQAAAAAQEQIERDRMALAQNGLTAGDVFGFALFGATLPPGKVVESLPEIAVRAFPPTGVPIALNRFITGKDPLTGDKLEPWQEWVSLLEA